MISSRFRNMIGRRRFLAVFAAFLLALLNTGPLQAQIFFCGHTDNDLYQLFRKNNLAVNHCFTPLQAVQAAGKKAAVFLTASGYPNKKNHIDPAVWQIADQKDLRLYVEYPDALPQHIVTDTPVSMRLQRAIIVTPTFQPALPPMHLLGLNDGYILPVQADSPLIVMGKVAGFDRAVYGLKGVQTYPLLFQEGNALIAMSKLSNFASGRYGPQAAWKAVWTTILSRMLGKNVPFNEWLTYLSPMYGKNEPLPKDAIRTSVLKGAAWFYNGHFFIDSSWRCRWLHFQGDGTMPVGPPVPQKSPNGNGSLGILEGHASKIEFDGKQQYRYWLRADVQGETAYALAAAADYLDSTRFQQTAINLIDFVLFHSNLRHAQQPDSPLYGLIGWSFTHPGVFYGDDNARCILGIIGAAAYMKSDRWDQPIAEAILANFRTTGKEGFRGNRLEAEAIAKNGWSYYWNRDLIDPHPHFESWMWACYLWLYRQTGYAPLLEKTEQAIRITMENYPTDWKWTNGIQQERARMILPLAWLVQIDDNPEHRQWLDQIVSDLLKNQVESGAIREELGSGKGLYGRTPSNDAYGKTEAPLIFENGDPVADMLYTSNFAFFSLNEAAQATGNPDYRKAVQKLSEFLTRIQVKSHRFNDVDGAWFRAFDYQLWDYWASNADAGWGAWSTLTGWIQSWIVSTQVLVARDESYWTLTSHSHIRQKMQQAIATFFKENKS